MFEEIGPLIKSQGGAAGGILAGVLTLIWMLRKFILTDRIESASSVAHVDLIQRLTEAADRAEARANQAEARADVAYQERNAAYEKIGQLTEQVRALKEQVENLQRSINAKSL